MWPQRGVNIKSKLLFRHAGSRPEDSQNNHHGANFQVRKPSIGSHLQSSAKLFSHMGHGAIRLLGAPRVRTDTPALALARPGTEKETHRHLRSCSHHRARSPIQDVIGQADYLIDTRT